MPTFEIKEWNAVSDCNKLHHVRQDLNLISEMVVIGHDSEHDRQCPLVTDHTRLSFLDLRGQVPDLIEAVQNEAEIKHA